jgi:oxalate decarboxylase/phosphoglucose isomerase-like protein (cupin superfamily)
MTSTNGTNGSVSSGGLPVPPRRLKFTHDRWMDSLHLPIHQGYFIEDLRQLELSRWEERGCDAAFIQLEGQQGITETRVHELPAQAVLPPVRLAFDEVVYVVQGRGATTIWSPGGERKSFEWGENSMFLLPRHHFHQFSNTSGTRPARLLHYNYFPLMVSASPEPEAFITTNHADSGGPVQRFDLEAMYAEPALKEVFADSDASWKRRGSTWVGSFFPDMSAWDKLSESRNRGAGGRSVAMEFPGSEIACHMSMFPPRTYKKAHRHGPGRAIVIPAGEGYSVMWEEGKDKVIAPWRPGSLITPPNKWFHQHFNTGQGSARYVAFHPPLQFDGHAEKVEDRARDQIEYVDEDPAVREMFESELAKRGLTSVIPDEAYANREYEFAPVAV